MEGVLKSKKGKERNVSLVEKRFYWFTPLFAHLIGLMHRPNFGVPIQQFKVVSDLVELNKKEKLGIHLPPTIRLRKRFLVPSRIITTRLNVIEIRELGAIKLFQFWGDCKRQREILEKNGFACDLDSFLPVQQKDGSIVAVLADFGTLAKIEKKK